jgi:hypothetical protein
VNLIQHQTTVSKNNFGGAKMCNPPLPSCSECYEFAFGSFEYGKKAIPLQALTGPEGSRRLRLPDFKTIGT